MPRRCLYQYQAIRKALSALSCVVERELKLWSLNLRSRPTPNLDKAATTSDLVCFQTESVLIRQRIHVQIKSTGLE